MRGGLDPGQPPSCAFRRWVLKAHEESKVLKGVKAVQLLPGGNGHGGVVHEDGKAEGEHPSTAEPDPESDDERSPSPKKMPRRK